MSGTVWIVSYVLLWIAVIVLGFAVVALLRQIGVLHTRVAPMGVHFAGEGPERESPAPDRSSYDYGSAPITLESGGLARVGGRPITIWRGERVVVQDASGSGEVRYHDAARRYFERLAEVFPLRLELVRVHELGRADAVVERAFASNARLIALRVANEHDAKPVLEWLDASPKNRALLFHSASYPAGRRVFDAFPGRTSFGDPRPRFVSSHEGS